MTLPLIPFISFLITLLSVKCDDLPLKLVNTTFQISKDSYKLLLKSTNQSRIISKEIDQRFDYSWIYKLIFKETIATKAVIVAYESNATIYEDNYTFLGSSIELQNFPIKVLNDSVSSNNSGGFGFTHLIANESCSMTHVLKKSGHIDHLAYAFVPNITTGNGKLYFGGIPEEIRKTKKSGICKVNATKKKWSCALRKVKFGNFEYTNTFRLHFQVGADPVYAPFDYYDALMKKFFNDYIALGVCSVESLIDKKVVKCKTEEIKKMPEFSITLDDFKYSLNAIDMFDIGGDEDYGYFNVLQNPHSNRTWQFGISFLKHFDTLFDYDNETITFFSDTKTITYLSNKFTFFLVNCGVLAIGIVLIVLIKCYCDGSDEGKEEEKGKDKEQEEA